MWTIMLRNKEWERFFSKATAKKYVKKLLEEGASAEDILVVAPEADDTTIDARKFLTTKTTHSLWVICWQTEAKSDWVVKTDAESAKEYTRSIVGKRRLLNDNIIVFAASENMLHNAETFAQ